MRKGGGWSPKCLALATSLACPGPAPGASDVYCPIYSINSAGVNGGPTPGGMAGLRPRLTIHGTDYPTRDGTCVRDYVHVADLAYAHVLALRYLTRHSGATAFNLGNGKGFTVREVITAAERVTGRKVPLREGQRRPGDPPALVANAASARRNLGWKPRYRDLEALIDTAWRWLRSGQGIARRKKT